jgi:type I restriction enzyme S subunit
LENLRGLSIEKKFIPSKANMNGVSLLPYKIVKPKQFCFVTITSRNSEKITLALNTSSEDYIVSSSYVTFEIIDTEVLDPSFLLLWFKRPEFDRYARFHSLGSARESFDYENMEEVRIPLPNIDTQRAIVNIYHCAEEAKRIAEEADRLSREICPAIMQHLFHESDNQ